MATTVPIMVQAVLGAGAGLIAGSFLATVAVRWPAGRRVARGRSCCDGCAARLRWFELAPIASWVAQRGRCRRCGARIARLHPLTELAGAAIGAASLAVAPGLAGAAGAVFGWSLLLLTLLDLRHHWLPDRVTLPLIAAGLAAGLAAGSIAAPPFTERLIGAAAGYAALEAVRRLYAWRRGHAGLGGGDPKLFAAIGAWLGWTMLPMVLLGASLAGLAVAGWLHLRGVRIDRATRLPFGAMLAPVAFMAWLIVAGGGFPG